MIDQSGSPRPVVVRARGGADHVTGSGHNDVLSGGAGPDTLVGGPGADLVFGGSGDDVYVLRPGGLPGTPSRGGLGVERIVGFAGAGTSSGREQDLVDIQAFGAGARLEFAGNAMVGTRALKRVHLYRVLYQDGSVGGHLAVTLSSGTAQLGGDDVLAVPGTPPANRAPQVAAVPDNQSVAELGMLSWQVPAGTFTDPDAGDAGAYPVVLTATDGSGASVSTTFTVTVVAGTPVAVNDTVTFDLRTHPGGVTAALLANDSDPDGDVLTASGSGTWKLDGDTDVAGTFSVDADGTLHLDAGTDPVGPVQRLTSGQEATATLQYTVSDGTGSDTGTVTVQVTGRRDGVVKVREPAWPFGQILDVNDPNPTLFDASISFVDPDGVGFQYSWSATSTGTVPNHPAFASNANVSTVAVVNSQWGLDSAATVTVRAIPVDGMPEASATMSFSVADTG